MTLIPLLSLIVGLACEQGYTDESRRYAEPVQEQPAKPVVIHQPTSFGVIYDPIVSPDGEVEIPAGTACETCHGPEPDPTLYTRPPRDQSYHTQIKLQHGSLSCYQCHDRDRTRLHLADGTPVSFPDVIQLCAQCHGPQYRDYSHESHGGASGYWDTRRGERVRNNCVDCHTPHAPAILPVMPVLHPRDRFFGESE